MACESRFALSRVSFWNAGRLPLPSRKSSRSRLDETDVPERGKKGEETNLVLTRLSRARGGKRFPRPCPTSRPPLSCSPPRLSSPQRYLSLAVSQRLKLTNHVNPFHQSFLSLYSLSVGRSSNSESRSFHFTRSPPLSLPHSLIRPRPHQSHHRPSTGKKTHIQQPHLYFTYQLSIHCKPLARQRNSQLVPRTLARIMPAFTC